MNKDFLSELANDIFDKGAVDFKGILGKSELEGFRQSITPQIKELLYRSFFALRISKASKQDENKFRKLVAGWAAKVNSYIGEYWINQNKKDDGKSN